ncbi:MAG: hypothetical protein KDH19_20710 [Geminicoccaceae bacterium]|nr:hypothetical protein [Geminicoccaceae bacterium]
MGVKIKISELQTAINRILDHIQNDQNIDHLILDSTDYWDILDGDRYNPKIPTAYGVGNLSDDWEFLSHVLNDESCPVSLLLIHAAPLLRKIGEQVGQ